MGDDLDTLLDEVERKFCGKVSVSAGKGQEHEKKADEQRKRSSKSEVPVSSPSDDLDAFIDKLLEEDCGALTPTTTEPSSKVAAVVKKCSSHSRGRKCCPVFIGGSSIQSGIGTTTSRRSCDQLRCMSCDFGVLAFDDFEWDQSCDYLFFRNNVPERSKLQAKLRRSRGVRSYCCQCSWTSVCETKELTPPLTWVCAGKHQD
ncbi:cilia- and flagella-associated protein 418 [Boleophthalmus pectinirostris]|uniref:cilia- and flagella-associated protein 418 n=1 Tax=Boleophthalmus pectinirostris TaxID=150288 RepID=UPI00242F4C1E|nr:cilia- and flagella-associated protein 418 [Boleophthalmus pectinirostris]